MILAAALLGACGPASHIPDRASATAAARLGWSGVEVLHPTSGTVLGGRDSTTSGTIAPESAPSVSAAAPPESLVVARVRALAPLLLHHRSEPFGLARAVAVVHPARPVIAYHLLWDDDAHGAWIPWTIATDQEVVWVGHDATGAPTDLWTYWHGAIVHTAWPGRQVAVTVQWGKHGSLPLGTLARTLPRGQRPGDFWAYSVLGLPDILLGRLTRPGPSGFFGGRRSYGTLDAPLHTARRLDAVVRTERPEAVLAAVFGRRYSQKPAWPWERHG